MYKISSRIEKIQRKILVTSDYKRSMNEPLTPIIIVSLTGILLLLFWGKDQNGKGG